MNTTSLKLLLGAGTAAWIVYALLCVSGPGVDFRDVSRGLAVPCCRSAHG